MAEEKEGIDLDTFKPDDARALEVPTEKFYCKMSDNTYNIKFIRYKIRDIDSGYTLVDINDEDSEDSKTEGLEVEIPDEDRLLRYQFGPDFWVEDKN